MKAASEGESESESELPSLPSDLSELLEDIYEASVVEEGESYDGSVIEEDPYRVPVSPWSQHIADTSEATLPFRPRPPESVSEDEPLIDQDLSSEEGDRDETEEVNNEGAAFALPNNQNTQERDLVGEEP